MGELHGHRHCDPVYSMPGPKATEAWRLLVQYLQRLGEYGAGKHRPRRRRRDLRYGVGGVDRGAVPTSNKPDGLQMAVPIIASSDVGAGS